LAEDLIFALEGALKMKEISYIHAEGYPAAEMKHGPIALIDENMPVIFIATKDSIYEKVINNIEEVKARKGKVIAIGTKGDRKLEQYRGGESSKRKGYCNRNEGRQEISSVGGLCDIYSRNDRCADTYLNRNSFTAYGLLCSCIKRV